MRVPIETKSDQPPTPETHPLLDPWASALRPPSVPRDMWTWTCARQVTDKGNRTSAPTIQRPPLRPSPCHKAKLVTHRRKHLPRKPHMHESQSNLPVATTSPWKRGPAGLARTSPTSGPSLPCFHIASSNILENMVLPRSFGMSAPRLVRHCSPSAHKLFSLE